MILKASEIEAPNGRRPYELGGRQIVVGHFVTRVTSPDNPFMPHRHERPELWFIIAGKAIVSLDGVDYPVERGDLVVIDGWIEHGLRADVEATWICLG